MSPNRSVKLLLLQLKCGYDFQFSLDCLPQVSDVNDHQCMKSVPCDVSDTSIYVDFEAVAAVTLCEANLVNGKSYSQNPEFPAVSSL